MAHSYTCYIAHSYTYDTITVRFTLSNSNIQLYMRETQ
uniref:Uncharacterized protein n=1 Tax=Anguilla anguilla TaxID=7936 RepID=A0A0E9XY06_ANGAN